MINQTKFNNFHASFRHLGLPRVNMSGFEYVFQPFKQELSKKTEDKVHLEIVKIG